MVILFVFRLTNMFFMYCICEDITARDRLATFMHPGVYNHYHGNVLNSFYVETNGASGLSCSFKTGVQ